MITAEDINNAYASQAAAKHDHAEFNRLVIDTKAEIARLRAQATAAGTLTGNNPDEREACARTLFHNQYAALATWEAKVLPAQLALELAEIEVERVRALLRLEEVLIGRTTHDQNH